MEVEMEQLQYLYTINLYAMQKICTHTISLWLCQQNGMVAEEGDPDTLLQQDGIYTRMVKLQTESQNWTLA